MFAFDFYYNLHKEKTTKVSTNFDLDLYNFVCLLRLSITCDFLLMYTFICFHRKTPERKSVRAIHQSHHGKLFTYKDGRSSTESLYHFVCTALALRYISNLILLLPVQMPVPQWLCLRNPAQKSNHESLVKPFRKGL